MQEVDINTLCESYQILGKNVPNDIIIVGKIDKLIIDYMYDFLDLSKVKCKKIIYCDQNGESIKNHILPNSLKFLECGENNLTSLPDNLPDSIEILSCYRNKLTFIPYLPNSLKELHCYFNNITFFADTQLPNSLENLYCYDNKLTSFDNTKLPNSLVKFYCWDNQLISLPDLPDSLRELNCRNNKLTSLPKLPTLMYSIRVGNMNLNKIEYNPDYRNTKLNFYREKIIVGNYTIESKEDYISYMEENHDKSLSYKIKNIISTYTDI